MMITMNKKNVKKEALDGNLVPLERGEKLLVYKNRITGEIVYSTSRYKAKNIQGKDFIPVFKKSNSVNDRRVNLMALDSISLVVD